MRKLTYQAEQIIAIMYCAFDAYTNKSTMTVTDLKDRFRAVAKTDDFSDALELAEYHEFVTTYTLGKTKYISLTQFGYDYARGDIQYALRLAV